MIERSRTAEAPKFRWPNQTLESVAMLGKAIAGATPATTAREFFHELDHPNRGSCRRDYRTGVSKQRRLVFSATIPSGPNF
jgi:hypothetical protein